MKLAISNIAWLPENDESMYGFLKEIGYSGLEIAPTRLFPTSPYSQKGLAKKFSDYLMTTYGLSIPSMQSIWYGRTENMFNSDVERKNLLKYTQEAIEFAETISCHNLVFGCPKNRVSTSPSDYETAIQFFGLLGDYAVEHNTVLSIEANPTIYNTNFINTTEEALILVKKVDSKGFLLNLDVGTIIYNNESLNVLERSIPLINHVHIGEPNLKTIEIRTLHNELYQILKFGGYMNYISIEMGGPQPVDDITRVATMIKDVFS